MPKVAKAAVSLNAPERILAAALEVFAEKGYSEASTREIARRAKVHQPVIAYHFENKERLWRAAADAVFKDFSAVLATGLQGARDPDERLRRLAELYVRFTAQKPGWAAFVVHEGMRTGDRSAWLIKTWLRPQAGILYEAITGQPWPARDAAAARRAISILSILTGSALIFLEQVQIKRLSAVDTRSAAFIEQHVQTVFLAMKSLRQNL